MESSLRKKILLKGNLNPLCTKDLRYTSSYNPLPAAYTTNWLSILALAQWPRIRLKSLCRLRCSIYF